METEQITHGFTLDDFVQLLTNNPPWWIYLVAGLIPVSILYIFREGFCWFWKINRLLAAVEQLQGRVAELTERLDSTATSSVNRGSVEAQSKNKKLNKDEDPYTLA